MRLAAGPALRVLTAHLKSKLLSFPGDRRYPRSENERQPSVPTVLCGDLNDGVAAVTTVLLEGPADGDPHRPDKGDPLRLYNMGRLLPPQRRTPGSSKAGAS